MYGFLWPWMILRSYAQFLCLLYYFFWRIWMLFNVIHFLLLLIRLNFGRISPCMMLWSMKFVKILYCQTPVQAQQCSLSQTSSWLYFPPVTRATTTTRRTPTKMYQYKVYYRLGIWNKDFNHKIKTSSTIPGMVTHHPKDSHPSNSTRRLTLAQPSFLSFLLV